MKDVVILGAGGHAHVIADVIEAEGNRVIAFLDDDPSKPDCTGPISFYSKYLGSEFIIGIGDPLVRKKLSRINLKWHTAIHPSAIVSGSARIDEGTVVMPNVVVNSGAKIGKHCIINTGAIVEHDNQIGDFCHISVGANLGGSVKVGNCVWVGIGATIKNNVAVANNVLIGAGSVVIKTIAESGTYVGVPSKRII